MLDHENTHIVKKLLQSSEFGENILLIYILEYFEKNIFE
jgi:hypothetical protein